MLAASKAISSGVLEGSQAVALSTARVALTVAEETTKGVLTASEAAYTDVILNGAQAVAINVAKAALIVAEAVYKTALTVADEVAKAAITLAKETAKPALDVAAAAITIGGKLLSTLTSLFKLNHLSGGFKVSTEQQMFFFKVDIVIFAVPVKLSFKITLTDIKQMLLEILKDTVHSIMGGIRKHVDEEKNK